MHEEKKENEIEVENETVENILSPMIHLRNLMSSWMFNNQETTKQEEVKQDDGKLEEYSKGVQSRIAKLTRKMREAERREQAAIEYAKSLKKKENKIILVFKKQT